MKKVFTHYTLEADCKNQKGEIVKRKLGTYYGQGGFSCPAWTNFGPTAFSSIEEVKEYTGNPHAWSAYDAHYVGNMVVYKHTTKIIEEENVEIVRL